MNINHPSERGFVDAPVCSAAVLASTHCNSWGAVAGAALGAAGSVLKGLGAAGATVPKLPPLSLPDIQKQSIAANEAALPAAEALASKANLFNADEWLKAIKFAFPEFETARGLVGGNILSKLRGEFDTDLQGLNDAAWGWNSGTSGAGIDRARRARNYGISSDRVKTEGENALKSWLSSIGKPGQFDISPMFITSGQMYGAAADERNAQFQRKYASNVQQANSSWMSIAGNALGSMTSIFGMGAGVSGSGSTTPTPTFGSLSKNWDGSPA